MNTRSRTTVFILALPLVTLSLLLFSEVAMAVEEPNYTVLVADGEFELREYAPKIIATTQVTGDYDTASRQGFKILADYIFGNNTAAATAADTTTETAQSNKISMTAPVLMTPTSDKIEMTAPVSMSQAEGSWQVSFIMPSQYTMQTIPKPNNSAVQLQELASQKYAVIRFSGLAGEHKVAKKTQSLKQWMASQHLTPVGEPQIARYNPPWTLPFMRRNEVMIAYET